MISSGSYLWLGHPKSAVVKWKTTGETKDVREGVLWEFHPLGVAKEMKHKICASLISFGYIEKSINSIDKWICWPLCSIEMSPFDRAQTTRKQNRGRQEFKTYWSPRHSFMPNIERLHVWVDECLRGYHSCTLWEISGSWKMTYTSISTRKHTRDQRMCRQTNEETPYHERISDEPSHKWWRGAPASSTEKKCNMMWQRTYGSHKSKHDEGRNKI